MEATNQRIIHAPTCAIGKERWRKGCSDQFPVEWNLTLGCAMIQKWKKTFLCFTFTHKTPIWKLNLMAQNLEFLNSRKFWKSKMDFHHLPWSHAGEEGRLHWWPRVVNYWLLLCGGYFRGVTCRVSEWQEHMGGRPRTDWGRQSTKLPTEEGFCQGGRALRSSASRTRFLHLSLPPLQSNSWNGHAHGLANFLIAVTGRGTQLH